MYMLYIQVVKVQQFFACDEVRTSSSPSKLCYQSQFFIYKSILSSNQVRKSSLLMAYWVSYDNIYSVCS